MKVGQVYSGFQLKSEKYVDEVKSLARVFEHKGSGARLLHLENDDDNKVFSIAFKTPPYDDTGVAHILEHCVLCGSKKYPTKEPFVELMKSSLNTFLNAITYPDKTLYPVASRDEKDFFNLMRVYVDSVFYPNIYSRPEIFMQEAWHYELKKKQDDLSINGVIYSEMKGIYASPENVLGDESMISLYSDTAYGYYYGGSANAIPTLTHEKFLDFHRKYYHPSNSYIYLYGNTDLHEKLKFLDENYLGKFKKKKIVNCLGRQKPFTKMKRLERKYSISKNESPKDKTFFALNYGVNRCVDNKTNLALEILLYYLVQTDSAPLKKAIIDLKIGEDVFGHYRDGIKYPMASIFVKNSSPEKEEVLLKIVSKTLRQLSRNGLNLELLEACINKYQFLFEEADYNRYPKGLVYSSQVLKNWLYGKNPTRILQYRKDFKSIRKLLPKGYFEDLIKKYFLKNKHISLILLKPEKGLVEKQEEEVRRNLKRVKEDLSEKELEKIIEDTAALKKYQNTPDSLKDIKKIPVLKIEDLSKNYEKIPVNVEEIGGMVFLHNPLETNDICYVNMFFNTKIAPFEKLRALGILTILLGRVDTKKHSYEELDILIQKYTGGLSFSRKTYLDKDEDPSYLAKLVVSGKTFQTNSNKLFEIIHEIITSSNFDDKKHIKEIIQEAKSKKAIEIDMNAASFALMRVNSYFSEAGKYNEYSNGINDFHFLSDLLKNFDKKWPSLKKDLEYLLGFIFNKSNLAVNIVCKPDEYEKTKKGLLKSLSQLESSNFKEQKYIFDFKNINEGLLAETPMQYVAQANNFKNKGYEYTGKLLVLQKILSAEYLWNRVRVQGGAYGSFCDFYVNGLAFFISYYDPNLSKTLGVYKGAPKFLRGLKSQNMDRFVIGTIGRLDSPLTPSMKGEKTLSLYFSRITNQDLQKEREGVLSTTVNDIKAFSSMLESILSEKYYCVLGNEGKIKSEEKLFNSLVRVNK